MFLATCELDGLAEVECSILTACLLHLSRSFWILLYCDIRATNMMQKRGCKYQLTPARIGALFDASVAITLTLVDMSRS
jgi:hypothetical protein